LHPIRPAFHRAAVDIGACVCADQFIDYLATKSSMRGKPYDFRFEDESAVPRRAGRRGLCVSWPLWNNSRATWKAPGVFIFP